MSACLERPSSQPRKSARSLAALSILLTELAPQEVHLHRVLPAPVLPFRFIFAPQRGQDLVFTAGIASRPTYRAALAWSSWSFAEGRTHILSRRAVGADQLWDLVFRHLPADKRMNWKHFLSYNPKESRGRQEAAIVALAGGWVR